MSSVKFSIIVPAYKEQGNLKELTEQVFEALQQYAGGKYDYKTKKNVEMVIVDDNSRDGSVEVVEELKKRGYPVDIIVRTKERGLSSAVIHGFKNAKGDFLMCMDADLQHPPKSVPKLFDALQKSNIEFTCGTRYGDGVEISKDWPVHRRVISWGARILARPLTPLSDPMSGFFALRRDIFERGVNGQLSPLGYKIALELYVKCGVTKFNEVGFNFQTRLAGESKLTSKVMIHYLKHLQTLYMFSYFHRKYLPVLLLFLYVIFRVIPLVMGAILA